MRGYRRSRAKGVFEFVDLMLSGAGLKFISISPWLPGNEYWVFLLREYLITWVHLRHTTNEKKTRNKNFARQKIKIKIQEGRKGKLKE